MAQGHNCTISGLFGAVSAQNAVDQGPIFNPDKINKASFDAKLSFAKVMNKIEDKNVNISNLSKDESAKGLLSNIVSLGRTPEAILPKQLFGRVDKKMTQWDNYYKKNLLPQVAKIEKKYANLARQAKGNTEKLKVLDVKQNKEMAPIREAAAKAYRELVGNQFTETNKQLQNVYNTHAENPKKLDANLKLLGFKNRQQAYYAHHYLNYLSNGGPFFDFNSGTGNKAGGDGFQTLISNITGKKISFDPKQVVYNVSEFMQKAPAVIGFKNTIAGVIDAQKAAHAAKKTIFDKLPELERAGIYRDDYSPLRPTSEFDTTTKTQNMLDNLAYYGGKRAGNVSKALKGIAYRPKPWNDTFGLQDPKMKNWFQFMTFQFRHMQQYGGWVRDITPGLNKGVPPKRVADSAKSLVAYSLMTGLIFGDRAAIPAPIYWLASLANPELEDDLKDFQKDIPVLNTGLVGEASKLISGGNLDIDMTQYVQPLGGVAIGIGTDMAQGTVESFTKSIPKIKKEIDEGNYDKAIALGAKAGISISQIFKGGANAFVQKTVDGIANAYIKDEFDPEGIGKNVLKKYLGKEAVK